MNRPILKFFTCKRKFINQLLLPSKFLLALFLFGLNALVYVQKIQLLFRLELGNLIRK
jgi:hypothetical protein